ncbi:uncharacterized protein HaLaN_30617, partial [Haematococcus lacustris]
KLTYRGKVLNRAARTANRAEVAQVMCTARLWRLAQVNMAAAAQAQPEAAASRSGVGAAAAAALPAMRATNVGMCALKGIRDLVELFSVTEAEE